MTSFDLATASSTATPHIRLVSGQRGELRSDGVERMRGALEGAGCLFPRAARALLSLRPMDRRYELTFSPIELSLLPTDRALAPPLWKRVGRQVFVPGLPRLETRYPRLVMPGGYLSRELSHQVWAYNHLAVNLMDLVHAVRGFSGTGIADVAESTYREAPRRDPK